MNQSDIRGLSRSIGTEPTLIFSIGSILPSKNANSVRYKRAYHIVFTHIAPIVPAPVSILPCIKFSKIWLRRLGDKKKEQFIRQPFPGFSSDIR